MQQPFNVSRAGAATKEIDGCDAEIDTVWYGTPVSCYEVRPNGSLMSILTITQTAATTGEALSPVWARGLFVSVIVLAAATGILAADPSTANAAIEQAGADLTRLLRLMALIKAAMAAAAFGGVLWRFQGPVSAVRFSIYALAGATMAAGPGLVWGMAHAGLGTLLLHGGFVATIVLMWRDPAVEAGLDAAVRRRTAR